MIIQLIIAIITGVISFAIVDQIISQQTWSSSLAGTIASYIVPIGLLGLLGLVAFFTAGGNQ